MNFPIALMTFWASVPAWTTATRTRTTSTEGCKVFNLTNHLPRDGSPLEKADAVMAEARAPGERLSYSGFVTVDWKLDATLFFWFFLSLREDWRSKPVVFYVTGGEESTLTAIFEEGPAMMNEETRKISSRPYWGDGFNVFFCDREEHGFSYSKLKDPAKAGLHAEHALNALDQLYRVYPFLRKNPLVLAGESAATEQLLLAGEMIVKDEKKEWNLYGLFFANPFISYRVTYGYVDFMREMGIGDALQLRQIDDLEWKLLLHGVSHDPTGAVYALVDMKKMFKNLEWKFPGECGRSPDRAREIYENLIKDDEFACSVHVGRRSEAARAGRYPLRRMWNLHEEFVEYSASVIAQAGRKMFTLNFQSNGESSYGATMHELLNLHWERRPEFYYSIPKILKNAGNETVGIVRGNDVLKYALSKCDSHRDRNVMWHALRAFVERDSSSEEQNIVGGPYLSPNDFHQFF